jgi:hypothetical protein
MAARSTQLAAKVYTPGLADHTLLYTSPLGKVTIVKVWTIKQGSILGAVNLRLGASSGAPSVAHWVQGADTSAVGIIDLYVVLEAGDSLYSEGIAAVDIETSLSGSVLDA